MPSFVWRPLRTGSPDESGMTSFAPRAWPRQRSRNGARAVTFIASSRVSTPSATQQTAPSPTWPRRCSTPARARRWPPGLRFTGANCSSTRRASIHVSTPRRVGSIDGIVVHGRRNFDRLWHRGLPTTTVAQALLDFAATAPRQNLLRLALANADYHDLLDVRALAALTGRGIEGSRAIHEALRIHLPQLAHTRSELEILLLSFCQRHGLPIPKTNVLLHGHLTDALWPDQRVIVEVDGLQGHRTRAQLERDHQRDLELRAAGYIVLRYTWRQLNETPSAIAEDLRRYL